MKSSVIIPVRNEEGSIRALLDSLLNQTLKPTEIVITDGGSTDSTAAIISEDAKREVPIRILTEPGALPGRAGNLPAAPPAHACLPFPHSRPTPHPTPLRSA